jgi:PAS domain S-box-containing protein
VSDHIPTDQNRARFEQLFEVSPDALVVTGPEGAILRVNPQAERLFGYTSEEMLGQRIEMLVPDQLHAVHMAHRKSYHANPRSRPMGAALELFAKRRDGSQFPVDIMLSPVASDGLALAVVRDITARKQAEQQLARQAALLESAHDAIIVRDLESRITYWNRGAEARYGWTREEASGQVSHTLLQTQFPVSLAALEELLAGDGYWEGELVHFTKTGKRIVVASRQVLQRDKDGNASAILEINNDVTERKRAEDELRHSEELFRSLVESVKDYAIFMLDPTGHVSSWSSGAERIKGYRADEIIGQHFSKFYLPADIERGKPQLELQLAAERGRIEDEGWRVRKDGSRFWANIVVTALRDASGNLRGFSKVARDFTDRKKGEETLLLEVTNVLIANLDVQRLFAAISAGVRQIVSHDYAGLVIYNPNAKDFQVHSLTAPADRQYLATNLSNLAEGSPALWAFNMREPVVINRIESGRYPAPLLTLWQDLGIASGAWLPIVNRGRALGVMVIASRREDAFVEKDVRLLTQLTNQVAVALDNAIAFRQMAEIKTRLEEEKLYLEDELKTEYNFEEIVGESAALKRVLKQVETVACTDATVLIQGETGTGKELIARAIHSLSSRHERTFVKLNCAAIPSGLLESELFGHEKGAFTGAISQKIGRLELAHEGTLLLDEIGDIPLELQPKLLRALQEKEFERLGSTRTIPVDARLVAATNRDLAGMVKDKLFRSDLYYRLKVFPIFLPALRERPEDIPLLVHYFLQKHAARMNRRIENIPPETMQALTQYRWPGNVRELENLIERAVILSRGSVLRVPLAELEEVIEPEPEPAAEGPAAPTELETVEREHILRVLRETKGVIAGPHGAASRLGLKRTTLNFRMRKLGISRDEI